MISKEWRDARWKLVLAAVAVLAFVAVAPRSYEAILDSVEFEIRRTSAELASPEEFMPPEEAFSPADYEEEMRSQIEEMRQPDYPVKMAGWEMKDLHAGANYMVLVPLAALLGVALVSGEVSRGTVFLLLSRPISRTRILLTKYFVNAAVLFAVALLGGVSIVISGYAHGYPAASIDAAEVLASSGLFWLGTVSVLGLALLVSVLFRDVFRSVVATAVAAYAIFSFPNLMREVVWWLSPPPQDYFEGPTMRDSWYDEPFEAFRITNYWYIRDAYEGGPFASQQPGPVLSILVCLATAVSLIFAALWLFRRKGY